MKDSITINCDDCAAEKIKQKVCHEFRFNKEDSEEYLVIDFHDFKLNFKDFISLVIIIDC